MKILVDADACPVKNIIEKIAKDIDSSLSQSAKEELLFRKAIVELSL